MNKSLFNYEYTSQMENKLDEIMEGKNTIKNICDEVYQFLSIKKEREKEEKDNNIIRVINKETSIRKSKHGEYIYYKKNTAKRPTFISLEGFEENYLSCSEERLIEWVNIKLK